MTEWQNTHKASLNTGIAPPWVTKGRTLLIMKDIKKGGVPCSYKTIAQPAFTCLKLTIETRKQGVKYGQS